MLGFLARAVLGKILGDATVKRQILNELRNVAAKSDTKIDDEAVDALEVIWDVAGPILLGIK